MSEALDSSQTCVGTPTGQVLSYDNAGRLTSWANAPSGSSVSTASFLYDGGGQRVEQQDTPSGGSTNTTRYLFGGLEEDSGGTITKYYTLPGLPSALRVGTDAVTYLTSDRLGSVSEALDGSGDVVAAQLYAPYGGLRYTTGSMPTAKGLTGQRADALTGLDYYGARYYDPAAGQFTSADTVAAGLSPYAYVAGNPETGTDPTGHRPAPPGDMGEPPQPNNDNWPDYGHDIMLHRHDGDIRDPWFDTRWFVWPANANKNQRRAFAQEQKDGPILAQYFGLTVVWQDQTRKTGRTADYLVGLDARLDQLLPGWLRLLRFFTGGSPIYSSDFESPRYGTLVDLYYPVQDTDAGRVRDNTAAKHDQAPIVAVDISDNSALQGMTPTQLQGWADNVIKPGGKSTVNRVIVINNGVVVYDTYTATPWGPPPVGSTGGS